MFQPLMSLILKQNHENMVRKFVSIDKVFEVFDHFNKHFKFLKLDQQQKYKLSEAMHQDPNISESLPFLPLESSISPQPQSNIVRSQKKKKYIKGKSILFEELKKVKNQATEKKRECIVKYLKKQGFPQDTPKAISTLEKEGLAIPILEVAVALSNYDNQFLKELLDSKTIELRENEEAEIFELNKKLHSDPILSLLSESQQLKKLPKHHNQPSFVDLKQISPSKKGQLIDIEKGKLKKKSKSKYLPAVEFPTELAMLKKELMSLPYISRYKKDLSLKRHYKQKMEKSLNPHFPLDSSRYSQIKNVSDLNRSKAQFKNTSKAAQNNVQLENTLEKVLDKRNKSLQISAKDVFLPKIQNLNRTYLSKSLMEIREGNLNTKHKLDNIETIQSENIRQTERSNEENPEDRQSSNRNSQPRKSTLTKIEQRKFWPQYRSLSSYNNKKYVTEIDRLKDKVRSLTELSEVPSEQTLDVYYSLKRIEKNDLKKLQNQAFDMEKNFTNTKYKLKYNNLKEIYSKRLKQFTKDRKMRQFELQESAFQEQSNLTFNQIKINRKILQNMTSPKKNQK